MKRKFVIFIGGVAVVVAATVNLSLGSNNGSLSDLALANIEALARSESYNCTKSFYTSFNYSGSSSGLVNPNGSDCSPCPNVTTNGVTGSTKKCE